MNEQELIAQETAWEQDAEALSAQADRLRAKHGLLIDRLRSDLDEAESFLAELTEPLEQQRSALWDRIWDSQEARGVELPFMVKMTRDMRTFEITDTPFLTALGRTTRIGQPEKMTWGTADG